MPDYKEYLARRTEAQEKLADLRNAPEDNWEDMKTGLEKAWLDTKSAFHMLGKRIRF